MERVVSFLNRGERMFGSVHLPESNASRLSAKPGLVLCHGGRQARSGPHRLFVELARALCDSGVAVFRFDYRGWGDSEGSEESTISGWTDDVLCATRYFLDAFDIDRLHVWGHCAGALLAARCAAELAERVDSLVLCNPMYCLDDPSLIAGALGEPSASRSGLSAREILKQSARAVKRTLFGTPYQNKLVADLADHVEALPDTIRQAGTPTLFIFGDRDKLYPFVDAKLSSDPRWACVLASSSSERQVIRGGDHVFADQTHKRELIEATVRWVRTHSAAAKAGVRSAGV